MKKGMNYTTLKTEILELMKRYEINENAIYRILIEIEEEEIDDTHLNDRPWLDF
jgi:Mor family transcriptional regulator